MLWCQVQVQKAQRVFLQSGNPLPLQLLMEEGLVAAGLVVDSGAVVGSGAEEKAAVGSGAEEKAAVGSG